jgi:hypothetical protein
VNATANENQTPPEVDELRKGIKRGYGKNIGNPNIT